MQPLDDSALLRQYAGNNSDDAFTTLVTRHINLVYSVALRQVGNPHHAKEITQIVFIILAKKAGELRHDRALSSWLFRATRLTANNFVRSEIRRQRREQEAFMQSSLNEPIGEAWPRIAPLLDTAVEKLNEKDRRAVLLRFYEGRNLSEVGAALGASEDAAKKRVTRAVEKLRVFFTKRGVALSAVAIAEAISANSVQAAPAALTKSVTAVAMTKGVIVSGSTLTLIKGALKLMAWTKAKTAIIIGVGLVLAAATTTITVKEIQAHRTYPWQVLAGGISDKQVNQPPQVRILHSKFQEPDWATLDGKMIGLGVRVQNVVASAYGFYTPARVACPAGLPAGRFDYIACLPGGEEINEKALQAEVKQKFGIVGKTETRDTDVWLLKLKYPQASGLKRNDKDYGNALRTTPNGFQGWNESMFNLAYLLEDMAGIPVIDKTGLTNRFDFDLNCRRTDLENRVLDTVNQALAPLGLELVPSHEPIEMLMVEKTKN